MSADPVKGLFQRYRDCEWSAVDEGAFARFVALLPPFGNYRFKDVDGTVYFQAWNQETSKFQTAHLEGQPGGQGAIADNGDDPLFPFLRVAGDRHAESGGNRRAGMADIETIMRAFGAFGESAEPIQLT